MQFTTAFAAIMALATSASAAILKIRQEPLATLEAYNYSTCDVESVATIDILDQDCHNFEQGYGNAQATLANPDENCMFTLFSEKECNGYVYFQKPGNCYENIDGEARWSYSLTCA